MRMRLWLSIVILTGVATAGCKKSEPAPEPGAKTEAVETAKPKGNYGPGVTDTEIKLGQTMPYSGPASAYGTIGRVQAAYFKRVNEKGGINGRKINLISVDDSYSPPKTVEQVRKLVEEENVLAVFQTLGTPSNTAIQKYLNTKGVPQLFVSSGATKWGDPKNYPWTIGFNPSYQVEAKTYGEYIRTNMPKAKIAVLYQNDDFGKDYLIGLRAGLGDKASQIIKEVSYEVTDATVDSQMTTLQASKADTFINVATPKFAAMAIRKAFDSGWKPNQFITNVSVSVGSVLTPAGLDKSKGLISILYLKDVTDKQYENDPAVQEFAAFLKQYYPDGKFIDGSNTYGYVAAQVMEQVIKQCGDDLTRENIMKQAANLKGFSSGLMMPGVTADTSAEDFFLFEKVQLAKFNGTNWEAMAGTGPQAKL
ncbi:MAG TPA: ABC transporter substrate-binding protein [Polyangiales bacterium]|nr:ABC transporter substrate-binding protein [Polyangiales bacterium]